MGGVLYAGGRGGEQCIGGSGVWGDCREADWGEEILEEGGVGGYGGESGLCCQLSWSPAVKAEPGVNNLYWCGLDS